MHARQRKRKLRRVKVGNLLGTETDRVRLKGLHLNNNTS